MADPAPTPGSGGMHIHRLFLIKNRQGSSENRGEELETCDNNETRFTITVMVNVKNPVFSTTRVRLQTIRRWLLRRYQHIRLVGLYGTLNHSPPTVRDRSKTSHPRQGHHRRSKVYFFHRWGNQVSFSSYL